MSNIITIELCAEDRARLDRLTKALERKTCDQCVNSALQWSEQIQRGELIGTITPETPDETQKAIAEILAKAGEFVEAPKKATEEAQASTPTTTPPEEEKPTAEEPAEPENEKKATHADVKALYIQLAAAGKREAAKAVILPISASISGIPEDKLQEVYKKLVALEG